MKQYMILAIKLGTWKFRHGLIFKNKTIYYMSLVYMKYNSNTWTTEFCFYDIQNVNVIKFCIGTSR